MGQNEELQAIEEEIQTKRRQITELEERYVGLDTYPDMQKIQNLEAEIADLKRQQKVFIRQREEL